jgi:hypothetical protein
MDAPKLISGSISAYAEPGQKSKASLIHLCASVYVASAGKPANLFP